MSENQPARLRMVHRALSDPVRMQLLEALWMSAPQSAKELATTLSLPPDRLYYHLAQLEKAGLIEIAEYRPLPGGKVERLYHATTTEPPDDKATPQEIAQFLNTALEATQLDITAASMAKERGEHRRILLSRGTLRLTEEALMLLWEQLQALVEVKPETLDEDGVWTRAVVTLVDLEDRATSDE